MSQQFSLAEVAVNDGKNNKPVWIIIRDIVYDVSNYLDDHPGGGDLITEWAGKDATKEFDNFGHSNDAKNLLKPMRIGVIIEGERKANLKKKPAGTVSKTITEKQKIDPKKKRFSWIFC